MRPSHPSRRDFLALLGSGVLNAALPMGLQAGVRSGRRAAEGRAKKIHMLDRISEPGYDPAIGARELNRLRKGYLEGAYTTDDYLDRVTALARRETIKQGIAPEDADAVNNFFMKTPHFLDFYSRFRDAKRPLLVSALTHQGLSELLDSAPTVRKYMPHRSPKEQAVFNASLPLLEQLLDDTRPTGNFVPDNTSHACCAQRVEEINNALELFSRAFRYMHPLDPYPTMDTSGDNPMGTKFVRHHLYPALLELGADFESLVKRFQPAKYKAQQQTEWYKRGTPQYRAMRYAITGLQGHLFSQEYWIRRERYESPENYMKLMTEHDLVCYFFDRVFESPDLAKKRGEIIGDGHFETTQEILAGIQAINDKTHEIYSCFSSLTETIMTRMVRYPLWNAERFGHNLYKIGENIVELRPNRVVEHSFRALGNAFNLWSAAEAYQGDIGQIAAQFIFEPRDTHPEEAVSGIISDVQEPSWQALPRTMFRYLYLANTWEFLDAVL